MTSDNNNPASAIMPTYLNHCFVYARAARHDPPLTRKPTSGTTANMISK